MSKSGQNVEDLYKHTSKIKKDFAIFITSCGKFCFDKKLLTSLYYFFSPQDTVCTKLEK